MAKRKAKPTNVIHCPGSLSEQRPILQSTLDRLERCAWQANPDHYAQQTWARIKQLAEA